MQTPGQTEEEMERTPAEQGPVRLWESNSAVEPPAVWWRWDFLLSLVFAIVAAFLLPLDDADLPMHLRTGAWILEHGRVPLVEPFAWTRAGAPFYAYSWLPEVLYERAWRAGGATGVSMLHALLLGAVVVAFWEVARSAGWTVWATRLMLSVHLVLWLTVQPATRPQLLLAIALPLAWAAAFQLRERGSHAWWKPLLMVLAANVIAVNSHLFFILMPAPMVVLLAREPFDRRRVVAFAAATVVGWSLSPNALHLLGVLRVNFGANALLGAASPIMEMEPGFSLLLHAAVGTRLLAGGLLILPLLPAFAAQPARARWWLGLSWLAGLGLFGIAYRGLILWWLLALPVVAFTLATIPLPQLASTRRMVVVGWCVSIVGLLGQAAKAARLSPQDVPLPHPVASDLEPAVRWLSCAVPVSRNARGTPLRATTAFDYGSYLTWRLPQYSWSIDGRAIFPDSVARADARQEMRYGPPAMPPWRHSEVVLLAREHAVWTDIAVDSGWTRVPLPAKPSAVTLYVRRAIADAAPDCSVR